MPDARGPAWAKWNASEPYTIGVEEEVMLLDPQRDWSLAQRSDDVLDVVRSELRASLSPETHKAAIEIQTGPHRTVAGAIAELREIRRDLVRAVAGLDLALAAAGTHPAADWTETEITDAARYQLIQHTMRDLTLREPTFALHVHVGVADEHQAIELYNRMRVHLPLLLALSGSSPYWRGRDSGFASTRTILFQAFPRTGMPRRYTSYAEWVERVDLQIRSGALLEPTFLWWDVRPQPKLGTIEVRVMDAQSRIEDTVALVALVQSVARLELEEGYVARNVIQAEEVLDENRFLAARDGVAAALIDTTEEALRPVTDLLAQLLDAARPHARILGCDRELELVRLLAHAPGAVRQRRYSPGSGNLSGLLPTLVADFDSAPS